MLDILSPKGQKAARMSRFVMEFIEEKTGIDYVMFPDEMPSPFDGFLLKRNRVVAGFEIKVRDLSKEVLEHFGSWLLSKRQNALMSTELMGIPFIGILYLNRSDLVLFCELTNDTPTQFTKTQATINGGTAWRLNYYVPYDKLRPIRELPEALEEALVSRYPEWPSRQD